MSQDNTKDDDGIVQGEQKATLGGERAEGAPATEPPPMLLTDRINLTMANAKVQYDKLKDTEPMNSAWPLVHLLLQATNDLNFLVSKQGEVIRKLDEQVKGKFADDSLALPFSGRQRPSLVGPNGHPVKSRKE